MRFAEDWKSGALLVPDRPLMPFLCHTLVEEHVTMPAQIGTCTRRAALAVCAVEAAAKNVTIQLLFPLSHLKVVCSSLGSPSSFNIWPCIGLGLTCQGSGWGTKVYPAVVAILATANAIQTLHKPMQKRSCVSVPAVPVLPWINPTLPSAVQGWEDMKETEEKLTGKKARRRHFCGLVALLETKIQRLPCPELRLQGKYAEYCLQAPPPPPPPPPRRAQYLRGPTQPCHVA